MSEIQERTEWVSNRIEPGGPKYPKPQGTKGSCFNWSEMNQRVIAKNVLILAVIVNGDLHWSLHDNKSSRLLKTCLCILADHSEDIGLCTTGHYSLNFMIIIMSRHQHGYPWPSAATLLYRPSLLVGFQGYILYRHRALVCRFLLVVLLLLVHVKGSTGVNHLWVLPNFSSSVPHIWFF